MSGFPAAGGVATAIFVVALLTTLGGALIAVSSVRVIRGVCGLALCCIGLAFLYYFLGSPFLALMQILIYVGAVCITIVFAVMLAEPDEPAERPEDRRANWLWVGAGLLAAAVVLSGLVRVALRAPWTAPAARLNDGSLGELGKALLKPYSLAFEVISLVLLVAIVGALAVARGGRRHE